jgi:hypothetical protein
LFRADLHIHTHYSRDCSISPQAIVRRCLEKGISCIAITDHGTIEGALKTRELAPFPVIVGEEVYTQEGEIMGLFLSTPIPHGLPVLETIIRIREQGGLIGIPHPFDRFFRWGGGERRLRPLVPYLHFLEVFNARSLFSSDSAMLFAQQYNLLPIAGSDAHTVFEIGNAYIEMPEFESKEGFLNSLAQGKIMGQRSPIWVHFISAWLNVKRRF